tara:strand:+ start:39 stop:155 length:117 start_codon:yes stop_codon:yes gene_type:complete
LKEKLKENKKQFEIQLKATTEQAISSALEKEIQINEKW